MNELERMCAEVIPPAPDTLAAGRHRLLAEIRPPARRPSRQPLFLAVLAACVTATVLLGVFVAVARQGDHAVKPTGPPPWEAPIPWEKMRDDHYLYTQYVEFISERSFNYAKVGQNCPVKYQWTPVAGIRPGTSQIQPCGERARKGGGTFIPGNPNEIRDGQRVIVDPQPGYVRTLPTDPDQLIAKVRADTRGQDIPWHELVYGRLGFLLVNGFVPERLQAPYFTAMRKLPGVSLRRGTQDQLGRSGIALAKQVADGRWEYVFRDGTHQILGDQLIRHGKVFSAKVLLDAKIVAKLPPKAPPFFPMPRRS